MRPYWRSMAGIVAAGLIAAGCGVENPAYDPSYTNGITAADGGAVSPSADLLPSATPDGGPAQVCTPGAFLRCAGPVKLERCTEDGLGVENLSCPMGCNAKSERCNDCRPTAKPACNGNMQVSCNARGLLIKVQCPYGCFAGQCKGCSLKTYFADRDDDGYGDTKSPQQACARPQDFVLNDLDCNDDSKQVNPKQSSYFLKPMSGTKSYDYDCNKVEERQRKGISLGVCSRVNGACAGSGWMLLVPKCGGKGLYMNCVAPAGATACSPIPSMASQACR